jgi:hypothetical protein
MDPVTMALLFGLGGTLLSSATAPKRPEIPEMEPPDLPTPQRPNLPAGARPDMNRYLPQDWQQRQNQAYNMLGDVLGMGAPGASDALYESQLKRLQEARDERLDWAKQDALRRGGFRSGVLTENQNEVWEDYGGNVQQAARDAEVYNQGQRWQALNAILGARPMGYDVYSQQMGQYNTDLARRMSQYNIDLGNQLGLYQWQTGRAENRAASDQAAHSDFMGALGQLASLFFNPFQW